MAYDEYGYDPFYGPPPETPFSALSGLPQMAQNLGGVLPRASYFTMPDPGAAGAFSDDEPAQQPPTWHPNFPHSYGGLGIDTHTPAGMPVQAPEQSPPDRLDQENAHPIFRSGITNALSAYSPSPTGNLQGYTQQADASGLVYGHDNHGNPFNPNVNAKLMDILQTAATAFPLHVEATSGLAPRSTGTRNHPTGRAIDVQIYDQNGTPIANYAGNPFGVKSEEAAAAYPIYEQFAQVAKQVQEQKYPELSQQFRAGLYFTGGVNPGDLMHFDVSGGILAPPIPPQVWKNGLGNGLTRGVGALQQPLAQVALQTMQSGAPAQAAAAPAQVAQAAPQAPAQPARSGVPSEAQGVYSLLTQGRPTIGVAPLSPAVAAGAVGNMMQEAYPNVRPDARGAAGEIGIGQWMPDRYANMVQWTKANGLDPNSREGQALFYSHELQSSPTMGALANAQTPADAAKVIATGFERAGTPQLGKRAAFANAVASAAPIPGVPSFGPTPETGSGLWTTPQSAAQALANFNPRDKVVTADASGAIPAAAMPADTGIPPHDALAYSYSPQTPLGRPGLFQSAAPPAQPAPVPDDTPAQVASGIPAPRERPSYAGKGQIGDFVSAMVSGDPTAIKDTGSKLNKMAAAFTLPGIYNGLDSGQRAAVNAAVDVNRGNVISSDLATAFDAQAAMAPPAKPRAYSDMMLQSSMPAAPQPIQVASAAPPSDTGIGGGDLWHGVAPPIGVSTPASSPSAFGEPPSIFYTPPQPKPADTPIAASAPVQGPIKIATNRNGDPQNKPSWLQRAISGQFHPSYQTDLTGFTSPNFDPISGGSLFPYHYDPSTGQGVYVTSTGQSMPYGISQFGAGDTTTI
jgi:hypothetical protein